VSDPATSRAPLTPHSDFPAILECFSTLLHLSPTDDIWAFDTSPDLPHTLFSEIKNNPSFQTLLESQNAPAKTETPSSPAKGKSKDEGEGALSWITPFLKSLIGGTAGVEAADSSGGGGFGEALAKVMNFCFLEMQHTRLGGEVRAAAAHAGFQVSACILGPPAGSPPARSLLT
jgi:senataxin